MAPGLVPAGVIELISNIFGNGFSVHALLDPTCTEMPPVGHPRNTEGVRFNNELVASSGGMLPLFAERPRYMSVTCGHTSMGFRRFEAEMPCDDPRYTQDGRLNLRRLQEAQPAYAHAVTHGISWDVLRWPAEDAFPWLPELLQESGNAGQQIARGESRLEVMLKIMEIAKRNVRLGKDPWDDVELQAARGGLSFKDELPGLIAFVKDLSGGLDDPSPSSISATSRGSQSSARTLGRINTRTNKLHKGSTNNVIWVRT